MAQGIGRKTVLLLGMILWLGVTQTWAEAGRIDAYRTILSGGSYTIRYDNITPAERVTNRDKMELFGKNGMAVENNDYLTNRPKSGIIVNDGIDRYEEVGDGEFNTCLLTKGKEDFFFTKYKKDGGYEYFGIKKNKVEANAKNYLAEAVEGKSYGDADMSHLLNAMLSAGKPGGYSYVTGGSLGNGLAYEDYKKSQDGKACVIRYYFRGPALVKIAAAYYYRKPGGGIDGHKCIIRITEFKSVSERSLLQLPAGVQDVTKRKGNKEKTR